VRVPEIQQYLTDKQVEWEFIVEKAPWCGGFWERLVSSIKSCLKNISHETLTFEGLRTLLVEIEATINNRPLTYMYDDENGISFPLTSSDLLHGCRNTRNPNVSHYDVISTSEALTKQAKHHFKLLADFNKQWSKEYLLSPRENHRVKFTNGAKSTSIAVGQIVLLRNEGTAWCFWKLAKELI